ncbi:MAG: glycosyltransferase [Gammaproteobacteria bacterium]|nr:glycosyltransferase [Gammaproteobacteria bacterium]MBQ0840681.1 glycosyltransferase [Gammaproteobacteria bacterium]
MRIVHVVNSLGFGGAENLVICMCKEMKDRGHQVTIISLTDKVSYSHLIDRYQLNVVTLGFSGTIYNVPGLLLLCLKLRRQIVKLKPDVINSHIFLADLCSRLTRGSAAHVTTLHRDEPWWRQRSLLKRAKCKLEAISSRRSSQAFIAVSKFAMTEAVSCLGIQRQQCCVIDNGVDVQRFSPAQEQARGRPIILQVGRFYPEKAHKVSLTAFKRLLQDIDCELWFVGDGPLLEETRAQAESLGITDHVCFLGGQSNVESFYRQATISWLPSYREGLPIVLLEAMACGLPVIASAVGAIPRLVKHQQTGVLIDAANEAQLLSATRGLLQDEKLRADLSQAARENVVNNFSIRATSDEYLKSYQHVLTQSFNE